MANIYCPSCNCEVDNSVSNAQRIAITFETNNGRFIKQYWHRSCLIGQDEVKNVSSLANSLAHSILDFGEIVKELRGQALDWERLLDKCQDLADEANEVLDEVIKWI